MMDPFDQLKKDWQAQDQQIDIDLDQIKQQTKSDLVSKQRKLIASNLFITLAFSAVFVVLFWVWSSFPDRSIYFHISLFAMTLLLVSTLVGLWAGVQFKRELSYRSTHQYLNDYLRKLTIRKFMIERFMPAYQVLLLLFFYLYYADILAGASVLFTFTAYAITTLFFLCMYFVGKRKQKKNIQEIEALIAKIQHWKEALR